MNENDTLVVGGRWQVLLNRRVDRRPASLGWTRGGVFECQSKHESVPAAALVVKLALLSGQHARYTPKEWELSCTQLRSFSIAASADDGFDVEVATYFAHGVFQTHSNVMFGFCVMADVGEVGLQEFLRGHLVDTQTEADMWVRSLVGLLVFIDRHGSSERVVGPDASAKLSSFDLPLVVRPHVYALPDEESNDVFDPKRRYYSRLPRVSLVHGRIRQHNGKRDEWGVLPYKQALMYQLLWCLLGGDAGYALLHAQARYDTFQPSDIHAFSSKHFRVIERNQVHLSLSLLWLHPLSGAESASVSVESGVVSLMHALACLNPTIKHLRVWRDAAFMKARYLIDWIQVLPPDRTTVQVRVGIDTMWRIYTDTLDDPSRYGSYGRVFDCCTESEHATAAKEGLRADCVFVCKVSPQPPDDGLVERSSIHRSITAVLERLEEVRSRFGDQADATGQRLACVVPRVPRPQWQTGDLVFQIMARIPSPHESCASYLMRHLQAPGKIHQLVIGLHYAFFFLDAAGVVHEDLNQDNLLVNEVASGENNFTRVTVVDFDRHTRVPGLGETGYVCGQTYASSLLAWLSDMERERNEDAALLVRHVCKTYTDGAMLYALQTYWKRMGGKQEEFSPWYDELLHRMTTHRMTHDQKVTAASVLPAGPAQAEHQYPAPAPYVDVFSPQAASSARDTILSTPLVGAGRSSCEHLVYDRKTRETWECTYSAGGFQFGYADGPLRLERIPLTKAQKENVSTWFAIHIVYSPRWSPQSPVADEDGHFFSPVSPVHRPSTPQRIPSPLPLDSPASSRKRRRSP